MHGRHDAASSKRRLESTNVVSPEVQVPVLLGNSPDPRAHRLRSLPGSQLGSTLQRASAVYIRSALAAQVRLIRSRFSFQSLHCLGSPSTDVFARSTDCNLTQVPIVEQPAQPQPWYANQQREVTRDARKATEWRYRVDMPRVSDRVGLPIPPKPGETTKSLASGPAETPPVGCTGGREGIGRARDKFEQSFPHVSSCRGTCFSKSMSPDPAAVGEKGVSRQSGRAARDVDGGETTAGNRVTIPTLYRGTVSPTPRHGVPQGGEQIALSGRCRPRGACVRASRGDNNLPSDLDWRPCPIADVPCRCEAVHERTDAGPS